MALLFPNTLAQADEYRPDFDCARPPAKNGVATMLCQNSDAAKHELEFDQVYYALRQVVGPDGRKGLRQQIILDENGINQGCGLPIPGAEDQVVPPNGPACYIAGMDKLTAALKQRLSGAALEEANRDIDTHIALQRRLRDLGYLPPGTVADGVYGEGTRGAIKAWQQAAGRPQAAGFISDGDAFTLSSSTIRAPEPDSVGASQAVGDGLLHTAQTAFACANPRATRALNNTVDPRQSDPGWVAFVKSDGRCFEVLPNQSWERISEQGGLLLLRRTPPVIGEPPLFFRPGDIVRPAPPTAVVAPAVPLPADQPQDTPAVAAEAPAPVTPAEVQTAVSPQPSVAAPAERPETPAPPSNGGNGGSGGGFVLIVLLIIIVAAVGVFVVGKKAKQRELEALQRERERRRDRALSIAEIEIEAQRRPLHVRRLQLVTADAYGTVDATKWVREREHFISTRVMPLLAGEGLSDQWELINYVVDSRIEAVAQAPLAGDPTHFVSDPQVFDPRMTPQDYELHCALLLRSAGWDAQTTVASGDQGTDVLARRDGKVLVVQCKLYRNPVGNDAVQQISAARLHQRADYAAVVSNATFTPAAKQLARTNGVYLLHHEELPVFDPAHHAA